MVKRMITWAAGLLVLMAVSIPVWSQAPQLTVEPDRTRLYEGEVLTLTVKGSMELDINLSNLFEFDMSDMPAPDIEKVEPDFEILAQNQQYSIRTVDSQMVGEITWTYQLAPTTTGKLTIPALSFRGTVSEPVTVEVVDGSPPNQEATARDSFIELSADKAEVYVQEQLLLTVRLFFRGNLIRGELSEPEHPNVIIEPLGRQQEFSRYRNGIRYRVVERKYALFPQRPGTLSLPPIRFEGQARDNAGNLRFLRDSEALFDVPVKEVPAQFTGDTWLPATALELEASGLPPTMAVTTGENLTREIRLTAAGLPSEALPPLPDAVPPGLRSYPEAPERKTETTPTGLTSSLSQSIALVPVEAGTMTLPEIRIPWWDTEADRQRVAVIPERTLTVAAPGGATSEAEVPTGQPPESPGTTPGADTGLATSAESGAQADADMPWAWTSLGLALLWLVTVLVWWWRSRSHRVAGQSRKQTPTGAGDEPAAFERLVRAAREGAPETPELLVAWANLRAPGLALRSVADVASHFRRQELAEEIHGLQARLFAPPSEAERQKPWDGQVLIGMLREVRGVSNDNRESDLPPLYPRGLA